MRLRGLIRFNNDDDALDLFYKYDVHSNMSRPFIKSCVKFKFFESFRCEGLI